MPSRRSASAAHILPLLLIVVSLACSLPTGGLPAATSPAPSQAPTAPLAPTLPPPPLPPALVESDPAPGSEIPLDQPVSLYFNQAMQRASVEAALSARPVEGSLAWQDDATLTFTPQSPLQPGSTLSLQVAASARSASGLSLSQPLSLTFQVAGYLRLVQGLPQAQAGGVDPSSAVVAAFNQPVVPLGGDPAALPPAFHLEPEAQGRGEWANTSTYIFYPQPALLGGRSYTVHLNTDLRSSGGGSLEGSQSWSFTTAAPQLLSISPVTGAAPDAPVVLSFNQPMDAASLEANFQLSDPSGKNVPGAYQWSEDQRLLSFQPQDLLVRGATYTVRLEGAAQAAGGTPLGQSRASRLQVLPALAVQSSEPAQGGFHNPAGSLALYFSAPLLDKDFLPYISLTPQVSNLYAWYSDAERALRLSGDYLPSTDYTLVISSSLPDRWGGSLGQDFVLNFRSTNFDPSLTLMADSLFVTPQESRLPLQVTNIFNVPLSLGSLPLMDYLAMLGPRGFDLKQGYQPAGLQSWEQALEVEANQSQSADLYLTPDHSQLKPGLYFLRFNFSQPNLYNGPWLIAASHIQLTFKHSPNQALVWAVDLRSGTPLAGAPVSIYTEDGSLLASGQTDSEGIFSKEIPLQEDPYRLLAAVVAEPGQDSFGVALSTWEQGIGPWDFGLSSDFRGPHLKVYLYSDRPIYRPGQTVYFRAILRQAYNGRYDLPQLSSLPLSLYDASGKAIRSFDLPLSAFGSAHGQFTLESSAAPGFYSLQSPAAPEAALSIQVASYRKPEINLQVSFSRGDFTAGQPLQAQVDARYFFDAPAGNLPLRWALYASPGSYELPGYQAGLESAAWLGASRSPTFFDALGIQVAQGEERTMPDGELPLELPTSLDVQISQQLGGGDQRLVYTLEVTAQDESGLPVSARATALWNPADFYIGLRPDAWVGRAREQIGFDIQVASIQGDPRSIPSAGVRSLRAEYRKVVWVRQDSDPDEAGPRFSPQYTPLASTDFRTNEQGQARVAFTPPEPGTYQIVVSGDGARSELTLWVGGAGQAVWPNLPNQRLRLTSARGESPYQPGETAQIFIPNPLGGSSLALVSVERGDLIRHQIVELEGSGASLSLPLGAEDVPNVYLSVTLLGRSPSGQPDFRQGLLQLRVQPVEKLLQVRLTSQPQRVGPGDTVSFEIQASDASGSPVQGEFSLAVVDLAALALAKPNAPQIVPVFYGEQPLGVRTSLDLAAYAYRSTFVPPGRGGGGEGPPALGPLVRERFPDTAYWNAEIITGADGRAQVSLQLPDSLTTWQADLRGLASDTRVGESQERILTSKELLIRPVTPRFLVAGDHVQLAAIVNNNTSSELQVQAALQASGVNLDDPAAASQSVRLAPAGRARLEWWGTVQEAGSADLLFSARSGSLQDAARPTGGALPILHYTARQSFRTAGTLEQAGEKLELVSLPRAHQISAQGDLQIDLSPSLAAAMLRALDALDSFPNETNEAALSRLLPNLETYRVLQEFGLDIPGLKERLQRALDREVPRLLAGQNPDGGWGWQQGNPSEPYLTAYALFGLIRAQEAGVGIPAQVVKTASQFLIAELPAELPQETWQLDRLTFEHFALSQAEAGDRSAVQALYDQRALLNPWSQALLALSLEKLTPGSQAARTLISDLQAGTLRSASGAHWELKPLTNGEPQAGGRNMVTTLTNSALVTYALAQRDPGSPLLADALRYLMAHRQSQGGWDSTYSTAWALMGLGEVLKGTGELGGEFSFGAVLNGAPLASGQASGAGQATPVSASVPITQLDPVHPNALLISRSAGAGRLYYTASLDLSRPVEQVAPFEAGLSIARAYQPAGEDCTAKPCSPLHSAAVGQSITVRLSLTLPQDMYYLAVQDFIPAGAEILDTRLATSQQGQEQSLGAAAKYDPQQPFAAGWGWWYFHPAQIYDDHIAWAADYLPAGSYELTYTLIPAQAGEFRVLPAHAWQMYFPEVQANSAGEIFTIRP